MRYVSSKYKQYVLDKAYRFYVTDALRVIGKLNMRYADIVRDLENKNDEPTETAEEIKSRIVGGLNKLKEA